jgi:GNAT superfamily N-acetyltransferase
MPHEQIDLPLAGMASPAGLEIHPVTRDRWDDLVALFETSPVMSSCWCMSQRLRASEFSRFGAEARRRNREMMHGLVTAGTIPGLLAYVPGRPVAWISTGPREDFARLRHSSTFRAEGDSGVWSIVCFYTHRVYRRQGISRALIQAAVQRAAGHGASAVEAYPLAGWGEKTGPGDAYTGMASTFRAMGFSEVGVSGRSRGQPRHIMRYLLAGPAPP